MKHLNVLPVATILAIIFALVGGVVVITGDLSFKSYLESMAIATAGLAIGRGIDQHPVG